MLQSLLLAVALTTQVPTQVEAQGIYAGFPHNVHDTRVFNGNWSSGTPQGARRAIISQFAPNRYRVSFQNQATSGAWHTSFSVEIPAGTDTYVWRSYTYAPFSGTVTGELYPPVVIRVH